MASWATGPPLSSMACGWQGECSRSAVSAAAACIQLCCPIVCNLVRSLADSGAAHFAHGRGWRGLPHPQGQAQLVAQPCHLVCRLWALCHQGVPQQPAHPRLERLQAAAWPLMCERRRRGAVAVASGGTPAGSQIPACGLPCTHKQLPLQLVGALDGPLHSARLLRQEGVREGGSGAGQWSERAARCREQVPKPDCLLQARQLILGLLQLPPQLFNLLQGSNSTCNCVLEAERPTRQRGSQPKRAPPNSRTSMAVGGAETFRIYL